MGSARAARCRDLACSDAGTEQLCCHNQRRTSRLLAHVEAHARSERRPALSADVSITARPFFERHGFTVEAEQHPVKAGVELTNYKMRKLLR
ncbi:GNAT family N-acetyltransferase [Arthrobacter livingstonensis]|uniref:GNAT family N-acetyltransferase n=1 Tax=Arthrobacter livingstonensis TaxID=670078 RepID=UPI001FEA24C2|nr:GNAT family N-acetyltransferase [Arthrobacter livingstonensis]